MSEKSLGEQARNFEPGPGHEALRIPLLYGGLDAALNMGQAEKAGNVQRGRSRLPSMFGVTINGLLLH